MVMEGLDFEHLRHDLDRRTTMQIWVDADACPKVIKAILFRAAERRRIPLILIANQPLHTPPSRPLRR